MDTDDLEDLGGPRGDELWRTTGHLLADAATRFRARLAIADRAERLTDLGG